MIEMKINTNASTPVISLKVKRKKGSRPTKRSGKQHFDFQKVCRQMSACSSCSRWKYATHETHVTSCIRRMRKRRTSTWTCCATQLHFKDAEEKWMKKCLCTLRERKLQLNPKHCANEWGIAG